MTNVVSGLGACPDVCSNQARSVSKHVATRNVRLQVVFDVVSLFDKYQMN